MPIGMIIAIAPIRTGHPAASPIAANVTRLLNALLHIALMRDGIVETACRQGRGRLRREAEPAEGKTRNKGHLDRAVHVFLQHISAPNVQARMARLNDG